MPHSSKLHVQNASEELNNLVKEDDIWLNTYITDETGKHLSWAAYHATKNREMDSRCILTYQNYYKCGWMTLNLLQLSMDIIRRAVSFLNPGQVPVVACDQPLFTIAERVQWLCPELCRR